MKRIEGVDVLRGLLACGIMLFHYTSWNGNQFHAGYHDVLNVLAVTAVEIFYVISGFSLYFVYRERLGSFDGVKKFFVRRFFRIAPLYYALLILVILIKLAAMYYGIEVNRPLDFYLIATNVTFLFGFIWPPNSLLVGGWSIGVEMVMYSFFPLLLMLCRTIYSAALLCFISIVLVFYYSQNYLSDSIEFSRQWGEYTFSINHFHFFTSGFFLYFVFYKYQNHMLRKSIFWLFLSLLISFFAIVIFYAGGVAERILIGNYRFAIFVLCACFVLLFALCDIKNKILLRLGELSYSIYLGHFFVYLVVSKLLSNDVAILILAIAGTYVIASITNKYIEKPMIKYGKNFL